MIYLEEVKQPDQTVNPLFRYLGVEVESISSEVAVLRLPLKPEFIQGAGVTAGGILATMADEAMAHVVLANLQAGESTATIEMNLRYLKVVKAGLIIAEARVVKKGKRVVTVEAKVKDASGVDIAVAGATFMVLSK